MNKAIGFIGICIIFGGAMALASEECKTGTFQVSSTNDLLLANPNDLDVSMSSLKVDEGNELEFMSPSGSGMDASDITKVLTCREYDAAIQNGLIFMTGTQKTPEFLRQCKTLRFLKISQPAANSCVEGYEFNKNSPDELTPSLGYILSGDEEEMVKRAEEENVSWKKFSSKMEFNVLSSTKLSVGGKDEFDTLEILGFGDFNHDGFQDMLIWTSNSGGGTLVQHDAIVLTRKDKKSIFRTLTRIE